MLHTRLKERTAVMHAKLHEHALLQPIQDNQLNISYYRAILSAFYAYYLQYEPQEITTYGYHAPNAPVLKWIEKDRYFKHIYSPVMTQKSPKLETFEDSIAYLYVKQGSTLGGQFISKELAKQLGLIGGEDQFFFYGYYKETALQWKSFMEFLSMVEDNINIQQTTQKACDLFSYLGHILTCSYETMEYHDGIK